MADVRLYDTRSFEMGRTSTSVRRTSTVMKSTMVAFVVTNSCNASGDMLSIKWVRAVLGTTVPKRAFALSVFQFKLEVRKNIFSSSQSQRDSQVIHSNFLVKFKFVELAYALVKFIKFVELLTLRPRQIHQIRAIISTRCNRVLFNLQPSPSPCPFNF
jgi:hypothetical protein